MLIENVKIPEGASGPWAVQRFIVSKQEAEMERLRSIFSGGRGVPEGEYTRLVRGGTVVMSDTPDEKRDHYEAVRRATGNVLINGLGLGMVLRAALNKPGVNRITVVELDKNVISLVAPHYADARVEIVNANAFDYQPPKGVRYDAVWHDIWDHITADNLPEMTRLKRKYSRRSDWQGCWCEYQCRRTLNR